MPPIFRMGREDTKVMTAIRSLGKTNCPFGLFMSEQTLASKRFGATPALHVSPVSSTTFLLSSSAISSELKSLSLQTSVMSRYASSRLAAMKLGSYLWKTCLVKEL
uniref:Uncharacterized protein n=1 Tax=Opuntia streptacantha TaxID=393608 RepID=A0A7C9AER1_OPUST